MCVCVYIYIMCIHYTYIAIFKGAYGTCPQRIYNQLSPHCHSGESSLCVPGGSRVQSTPLLQIQFDRSQDGFLSLCTEWSKKSFILSEFKEERKEMAKHSKHCHQGWKRAWLTYLHLWGHQVWTFSSLNVFTSFRK